MRRSWMLGFLILSLGTFVGCRPEYLGRFRGVLPGYNLIEASEQNIGTLPTFTVGFGPILESEEDPVSDESMLAILFMEADMQRLPKIDCSTEVSYETIADSVRKHGKDANHTFEGVVQCKRRVKLTKEIELISPDEAFLLTYRFKAVSPLRLLTLENRHCQVTVDYFYKIEYLVEGKAPELAIASNLTADPEEFRRGIFYGETCKAK